MFIMTLGGFGDIWDEIPHTRHVAIGDADDQKYNAHDISFLRQDPLVPLHRTAGGAAPEPLDCHDGRYLRQGRHLTPV